MATASQTSIATNARPTGRSDPKRWHWLRLRFAWLVSITVVLWLVIYGFTYYRLDLAGRASSPYHAALRPSGTVGLRLGMLGAVLFLGLFLYPIRKRWPWLNRIGTTRHWLDFHVLLGIVALRLATDFGPLRQFVLAHPPS